MVEEFQIKPPCLKSTTKHENITEKTKRALSLIFFFVSLSDSAVE